MGGEFYFSDVYCDRRLPQHVQEHKVYCSVLWCVLRCGAVGVAVCSAVGVAAYCGRRLPRGGGLGSSTIFKKFNKPYAPS